MEGKRKKEDRKHTKNRNSTSHMPQGYLYRENGGYANLLYNRKMDAHPTYHRTIARSQICCKRIMATWLIFCEYIRPLIVDWKTIRTSSIIGEPWKRKQFDN